MVPAGGEFLKPLKSSFPEGDSKGAAPSGHPHDSLGRVDGERGWRKFGGETVKVWNNELLTDTEDLI